MRKAVIMAALLAVFMAGCCHLCEMQMIIKQLNQCTECHERN